MLGSYAYVRSFASKPQHYFRNAAKCTFTMLRGCASMIIESFCDVRATIHDHALHRTMGTSLLSSPSSSGNPPFSSSLPPRPSPQKYMPPRPLRGSIENGRRMRLHRSASSQASVVSFQSPPCPKRQVEGTELLFPTTTLLTSLVERWLQWISGPSESMSESDIHIRPASPKCYTAIVSSSWSDCRTRKAGSTARS